MGTFLLKSKLWNQVRGEQTECWLETEGKREARRTWDLVRGLVQRRRDFHCLTTAHLSNPEKIHPEQCKEAGSSLHCSGAPMRLCACR